MSSTGIVHFAPLSWAELCAHGFRKTSGAMLKVLLSREDFDLILYVQFDRRWGCRVDVRKVDEDLIVIALPIGLPLERFSFIRMINRRIQNLMLRRVISKLPTYTQWIYWFYDWWNIELIEHLPENCIVMEVTDKAEKFIGIDKHSVRRLRLVRKRALDLVDLFFAVTPLLAEECKGGKGEVRVFPNAIDADFLALGQISWPEPEEMLNIPSPRICVVSTGWPLNHRVDHNLLLDSLNRLPDWSLVLIGVERVESASLIKLLRHPRVSCIGLVPRERLPSFLQHSDVCAVPYREESGIWVDSLKVYEYLACDRPVIVTGCEVQSALERFLITASTAEEFALACETLRLNPLGGGEYLKTLLGNMTWDTRAENCVEAIRGKLSCMRIETE